MSKPVNLPVLVAITLFFSADAATVGQQPLVSRAKILQSEFQHLNASEEYTFDIAHQTRRFLVFFTPPNLNFTPSENDVHLYGETIIALLKLTALTHEHKHALHGSTFPYFTTNELKEVTNSLFEIFAMNSLDGVVEWLNNNQELNKQVLTIYDHDRLLRIFSEASMESMMNIDEKWMRFVYIIVVRNSLHLRKQFTAPMMEMLNIIRNEMNAFHAMKFDSIQGSRYRPQFPLQMNLYRHDADDQFQMKLKINLARRVIEKGWIPGEIFASINKTTMNMAIIYCALLDLPQENFIQHIGDVGYSDAMYEITWSLPNDRIDDLHEAIENRLPDNFFEEHIKSKIEQLIKISSVPYYVRHDFVSTLRKMYTWTEADDSEKSCPSIGYSFRAHLMSEIDLRLSNMTRSTNAPQNYVQLLQFSNDFINSVTSTDINDIFVQLMLVHKWGNKFMSPEQLFEIDRMHTELYRKYTDKLRKSMIYMRTGDCCLSLREIFWRMGQMEESDLDDSTKRQISRFLLKSGVFASNAIYVISVGFTRIAFRREVSHYAENLLDVYLKIVDSGEDVFLHDSTFLYEWRYFVQNYYYIFEERARENGPYETLIKKWIASNSFDGNVFAYITFLDYVNILAKKQSPPKLSDEMMGKVLEFNERFRKATKYDSFIQEHIRIEQQRFYGYYGEQAGLHSKENVIDFVNQQMDSIFEVKNVTSFINDPNDSPGFAQFETNFIYFARVGILKSIYAAVSRHFGPEMKTIDLNIDLSEKLIGISDGLISQCNWCFDDHLLKQIKIFTKNHSKQLSVGSV